MNCEINNTEEEWRNLLSETEYQVLRNKDTEDARSGEYHNFQPEGGFFKCRACGNPLYSAQAKFASECGWPAFDKCFKESIITDADEEHNMIEIMCRKCGGHLGHIFLGENYTNTNERHCVNSVSIKYDKNSHEGEETKIITEFRGKKY